MAIGLFSNVIEAPDQLQRGTGFLSIPQSHLEACAVAGASNPMSGMINTLALTIH